MPPVNMSTTIPMANPQADNAALRNQILDGVGAFIDGGNYILGDEVHGFEQEFATQARNEAAEAIALSNLVFHCFQR
jgi:hypothetical protein